MRAKRSLLTLCLITGAILLLGAAPGAAEEATPPKSISADVELCAECHEEHVTDFALDHHSALDSEGLASLAGVSGSCAACHGDPSSHLDEGGGADTIFSFKDEDLPAAKNESCLTCHGTAHPAFAASAHGRAGMACTDCHSIHGDHAQDTTIEPYFATAARAGSASATCYECHGDVFAQFEFNERHRLQEGILDCVTCHDPHEASNRRLLGGFKQEACADCHTDKGGPFVFEHGSVRGEGCTSCHSPHGSPNRHMLAFQNVAETCYSCHAVVPGFHARFTLESQCVNCHSTIHGSNFDPFFLK